MMKLKLQNYLTNIFKILLKKIGLFTKKKVKFPQNMLK